MRAEKWWTAFNFGGKSVTNFRKFFKKQNLGMVFKTKNTTGKVLNMKKIDLQQTKYGAVAYTVTDIKTVILFTPDKQEDS